MGRSPCEAAERVPMQFQRRPAALCARTVGVEMTLLMLYALMVGVAVAILVAMPVVLLVATAS
jgi:hypothetical protein